MRYVPVVITDCSKVLELLPEDWEAQARALQTVLSTRQIAPFDSIVITPALELVDDKPTAFEGTIVVFNSGDWHLALPMDLDEVQVEDLSKVVEIAAYRLAKRDRRRKVA